MKKVKGFLRSLVALSALIFSGSWASGQSPADSSAKDDHDFISSIAAYPADVRSAILDVAQYPQVLVKLERIQAQSSQSFQDLISGYAREEQEKFYDMIRFPEIMAQMIRDGKNNPEGVKALVKDLPAETQNRLMDVYSNHFRDLTRINSMYASSQESLQKIISGYPQNVQRDFQKVISMPEVMNLLTDNIDQTVGLGEDYQTNPGEISQQLDSMNIQLASQNAKDLDDYKKEVAANPNLQNEMKSAADDFSSTNGQAGSPAYVTNNYYNNYPYSYWFSYPYWYSAPIWYPRPWYYYTGYYYGPSGVVIVGLPSLIYSHWFFGMGYRHYPILYHHYNNYCYVHRVNIVHHYTTFTNYGRNRTSGYYHAGSRPGRNYSSGRYTHTSNPGGVHNRDWNNGGTRTSTTGSNRSWTNMDKRTGTNGTVRTWNGTRNINKAGQNLSNSRQNTNGSIEAWNRGRQTQTNSNHLQNLNRNVPATRQNVPSMNGGRQTNSNSRMQFSNPGNNSRSGSFHSAPSHSTVSPHFSGGSRGGGGGGGGGGSHSSHSGGGGRRGR